MHTVGNGNVVVDYRYAADGRKLQEKVKEGRFQQTNEYYPYGDLFGNSGTGSSGNRFRYTGKELSDETGQLT